MPVTGLGFPRPLGRTFERPSSNTISKCGYQIRQEEANAMQEAHNMGIRVPKLHHFDEQPSRRSTILMEYIEGDSLEDVWPSMSPEQKSDIASQLRALLNVMRSATQDQFRIGGCGGPAHVCRRFATLSGGPFDNEADFNKFIFKVYNGTPDHIQSAIAQSLQTGHRSVFTHADLSPRNIQVLDGKIVGLLDWEYSGWFPEYWEYVNFFECVTSCRDWKNFADEIFEQMYTQELVSYQALARWQDL